MEILRKITYSVMSASVAIRHKTPLSIEHLPVIGSGGAKLMYGGSSKNVIFKWNFSGTPCGGVWLFPGQTISFISKPSLCHDFHTPICKREFIVNLFLLKQTNNYHKNFFLFPTTLFSNFTVQFNSHKIFKFPDNGIVNKRKIVRFENVVLNPLSCT